MFLKRSNMSCIFRYGIFLSTLILAACSDKKSEIATENGKYFVESLGENVDKKDLEQSIVIQSTDSNYNYRYGSINAKLSQNIISSRIDRYVNDDIKVFSNPFLINNSIATLSSSGKLTKATLSDNGKTSIIWQKTVDSNFCNDLSVGLIEDIVVTTCGSNIIRGFSYKNGEELWKLEVDSLIASKPLFTRDAAIFFAKNDSAYAVNYKSGQLQWYLPNVFNENNRSLFSVTPLLVDGYIIQQTYDDELRAINAVNGQIEWIANVSHKYQNVKGKEFLNHYGNIAYDGVDKTLYINNSSGAIVKLKVGSNKPDWVVSVVVSKPVWLLSNIILAVDDLGSIIALSKADGKIIWSNNILKNIIKESNKKDIFGKPKPYNEISLTAPIVIDGKIVVISSNNKLLTISPKNGKIIEVKSYGQNIFGQPFVHDGNVYVMTNNGRQIIKL